MPRFRLVPPVPTDPMFSEGPTIHTPRLPPEDALSPEDEAIIQSVLKANPELTRERAIAEAKSHGCL